MVSETIGHPDVPTKRRSDAAIAAAVAGDPDAAPIRGEAEWEAMLPAERGRDRHGVVRLRRRLGLSQVQFAARHAIPLSTLRQWEQGTREPDAASRMLLAVIARTRHWWPVSRRPRREMTERTRRSTLSL